MTAPRIIFDIDPAEQKANKKRRWFKDSEGDLTLTFGADGDREYISKWQDELVSNHTAPFQSREAKLRDLHKPYGVYDECGHEHTDEEISSGLAFEVDEIGYTCEEGLVHRVCLHCCGDGDNYVKNENCIDHHTHSKDSPICQTIAILDGKETE